jgi:hypothetical protein
MAKKKVDKVKKNRDLENRVFRLRFEDSKVKRNKTIEDAIASGRKDLLAHVDYHLGVNEKKYSKAIEYLTSARDLWGELGHYYKVSAERAIERVKDERRQKDRPLWKKILLPFRSAA